MVAEQTPKKTGIVTLVGRSNVGKSTLLNALVGFKVSITSPLPQTTRRLNQGVLNTSAGQAVFVDTPGLFTKTPNTLTKKINQKVREGLKDIDLILYVVDPTREIGVEERRLLSLIEPLSQKKIMVINKIDLKKLPFLAEYEYLTKDYNFIASLKVSAKKGVHLTSLKQLIFQYLPVGEPLYPADATLFPLDRRQWLAEIIREKAFYYLYKEIPYSITVTVEDIKQKEKVLFIKANILTTDKRYRGMIIGRGGQSLKQIGQAARQELELILQQKIYLDLEVQVDTHWPERF